MKLKLGQIRFLMVVLAVLALVLLPVGCSIRSDAVTSVALVCFLLTVFIWFFLYRCPHCGNRLGRSTGLWCPHCGEKL